ncbi:hypothetical protein [Pseudomonas viridiflava]|nr:hypothetical protein [Pseudomonas viridiflava]
MSDAVPVGAVLARDKNTAVYLSNRVEFIAGKHRSHMEPSSLRDSVASGM